MNEQKILLAFVEDWLKNNCVSIHHITPPCQDCSWLDLGLRVQLAAGQGYESLREFFAQAAPRTIYYLTDAFGCSYSFFQMPDSTELAVYGPVIFASRHARRQEEAMRQFESSHESAAALENFYMRVPFIQDAMAYYNILRTLGNYLWGSNSYQVITRDLGDREYWQDLYRRRYGPGEEPGPKFQTITDWYALETELLNALVSGSEAEMLDLASKMHGFTFLSRHTDRIRITQDRLLMLDALLRKTAETSGARPIDLEPYSSRHIDLIEQISSETEGSVLLTKIIQDYYTLVHRRSLQDYSHLIQKIIAFIDANPAEDLSLNAISGRFNANPNYISTLFRSEVGITLTEYVSRRRIDLAKRLLLATDMPIKNIAPKCGISDIHYFSRQFKKKAGCSPKYFREHPPKTKDFFSY